MPYLENHFFAFGSSDGDGDVGVGQLRQELVSAGLHVGRFAEKVADDGATDHLGHHAKSGKATGCVCLDCQNSFRHLCHLTG